VQEANHKGCHAFGLMEPGYGYFRVLL
jgi:hypothetical protein